MTTAAAAALEAGELNEAIRGLMLRAGVYAGLSRDQIGNLMRATGEALEGTTAAEAEEIFSRYMTTGNLPGIAGADEIRKYTVEKLHFPVDGYNYIVMLWKSVDGGRNFYHCGHSKYFVTEAEALQYQAEQEASS